MLKRWICWATVLLCYTALNLPLANAHDLPLDRIMNGFVKVEPRQLDFVVRVPLDLLRGAPFPLAGDHYKIEASGRRDRAQSSGQHSPALGGQCSPRVFERRRRAGAARGPVVRRL